MQFKHIISIILLQTIAVSSLAQTTNTPVLSQTSASGSVTTLIATPPEAANIAVPNIVRYYVPSTPVTDASTLNASTTGNVAKQQVMYSDGFNFPFQTISKNVSNIAGVYKNLVQISDNRVQQDQYSFLPFPADNGNYQANAFQLQRSYYGNLYPFEGYTCFSQKQIISGPTDRDQIIFSPGKSQVGQGRGTQSSPLTNGTNEVVIWELDGSGRPVASGYYGANRLTGTQVLTPTGSTGIEVAKIYKNKEGKVILKAVADSVFNNGSSAGVFFKKTYYVYGPKGELRYVLPPKLVKAYEDNNGSFISTTIDNLCFQYQYDVKGRTIGVRKPGEDGFTWVVYDRKERVVMKQTPNETNAGEWEITFYDALGRVKATSVFSSGNSQNTMQSQIYSWTGGNTSNLFYFLANPEGEKIYPSESGIAGNTIMSYNYYDTYDQADPNNDAWNSYSSQLNFTELVTLGNPETPVRSSRTVALLTGSKIRIIGSPDSDPSKTGEWRTSTNFYDDKGRIIYTVGNDLYQSNPIHTTLTGNQYDFSGRLLISKHVVINSNSAVPEDATHFELTKNQYEDVTGNLLKTIHKFDNGEWTTLASFLYDDMGRVGRKTLGNGGEVQDFTYTMDGALMGINGLYAVTGNKQGVSKTFGESLKFDYGFTQPRYDGKLSGIVWRGSSASNMYSYGYDYTLDGLLKRADFRSYEGGTWTNSHIDYSVSNLFYDKNGNIKSMNQKGVNHNLIVDMDLLRYDYEDAEMSNRLQDVTDNGVADYGAGDFQDGSSGNDYSYDQNGNLAGDRNKGISGVLYTRFNKPSYMDIHGDGTGGSIQYSYDAAGNKVQEIIKDEAAGGMDSVTDYIGNFVYKGDVLQYMLTPEGRTIISDAGAKEEYFVKDHLGNVRSTIDVTNYPLHQYLATYELASANLENLVFDNVDDVRDIRPGGLGDNTMAANLNGLDPKRAIGTSLLLHVMAGDKVSMNVSTYYDGYMANQDAPVAGSTILNSIISTLTGGVGGLGSSESHNTAIVNDVFTPENYTNLNNIITEQTDPSKPKAYLNYALFDENMQLVEEMSGAFQANSNGDWQQIGTTSALEIPKNGYLAVYLSNTSAIATCLHCSEVYFDQLLVQLSHGNLLEENHYYPHGLPLYGLGSVTSDANYKENRHRYQGNELTKSLKLNWMDFAARQYDPQLGRFLSVDPLAASGGQEMYSPYAAMGNMPESNIDPNGESPMAVRPPVARFAAVTNIMTDDGSGGGPASGGGGYNDDLDDLITQINNQFEFAASVRAVLNNLAEMFGGTRCVDGVIRNGGVGGIYAAYDRNTQGNSQNGNNYYFNIDGSSTPYKTLKGTTTSGVTYDIYLGTGTNGDDNIGAQLIAYVGGDGLKGLSDLRWMQVYHVKTQYGDEGWTVDGKDASAYPFYNPRDLEEYSKGRAKSHGMKQYFYDYPGRNYGITAIWEAQTVLVGKKDGIYKPIIGFSWGFSYDNYKSYGMGPFLITNYDNLNSKMLGIIKSLNP